MTQDKKQYSPIFCGSKQLKFTVLGNPFGQQRPRANRRTGAVYDPKESVENKENIRALATIAMQNSGLTLMHKDMPVELNVEIYKMCPSSPQWKRAAAELGLIVPTKKPDISNIVKGIEDAMNGVVYADDNQIFKSSAECHYSDTPRVEITVTGHYVNFGDIKDKLNMMVPPKPKTRRI